MCDHALYSGLASCLDCFIDWWANDTMCDVAGVTGTISLSAWGDRINKWALWSYGPGQTSYDQFILVDVTKPSNEVGGCWYL